MQAATGAAGQPVAMGEAQWQARRAAHEQQVDQRLEGHLRRRRTGIEHPVEDFLFTYYRMRPGHLRRWHPGVGTALLGITPLAGQRWYRVVDAVGPEGSVVPATGLDVDRFRRDRGAGLRFVAAVLTSTASREPRLGCLGLHEWAMVYRVPDGAQRHESFPLRLGPRATDEVVDTHRVACTHFDAYRFFSSQALSHNAFRPTRASSVDLEQPGCLHAGMDLYKWAGQLGPAVPGELLLRCFDLAHDIRVLDMQASPYDLAAVGYPPVRIETAGGKAEYVRRQAAFSDRGQGLRAELLAVLAHLGVSGA